MISFVLYDQSGNCVTHQWYTAYLTFTQCSNYISSITSQYSYTIYALYYMTIYSAYSADVYHCIKQVQFYMVQLIDAFLPLLDYMLINTKAFVNSIVPCIKFCVMRGQP